MADIELVIKIPEGLKKDFEFEQWTALSCMEMKDALMNSTPLPKGHGRLIDEERISLSGIHFETERDHAMMIGRLNSAPTIIEADKEYEVEVVTHGNCMICEKELTEGLFFCKECEDKASSRK